METVNGQRTERDHRQRARALWHRCRRVIRKVLSHTVAVRRNASTGPEPLRFSDNLARKLAQRERLRFAQAANR